MKKTMTMAIMLTLLGVTLTGLAPGAAAEPTCTGDGERDLVDCTTACLDTIVGDATASPTNASTDPTYPRCILGEGDGGGGNVPPELPGPQPTWCLVAVNYCYSYNPGSLLDKVIGECEDDCGNGPPIHCDSTNDVIAIVQACLDYLVSTGAGLAPWDLLPDYGSMIRATIVVPERVWISDSYTIGAYIQNNNPSPHVVRVHAFPSNLDICAVTSSGTSSSGTQVRENEYLLLANGSAQEQVPDPFSSNGKTGVGFGDFATLQVEIKPSAPGDCEVMIMVTVDGLLEKHWLVSTQIDIPPPVAAMGRFVETNGCLRSAAPASAPTTVTVTAGLVDVYAQLDYTENCVDDDAAGVLVVERLVGSTWVSVAGATMENSGSSDVRAAAPISLGAGVHTFRVGMAVFKDSLTWQCLASLGAAGLAMIAPLLVAPPIAGLVFAGLILGAIVAGIFVGTSCGDAYSSYHTITVEAKSAGAATPVTDLLPPLGDQVGEAVEQLDP